MRLRPSFVDRARGTRSGFAIRCARPFVLIGAIAISALAKATAFAESPVFTQHGLAAGTELRSTVSPRLSYPEDTQSGVVVLAASFPDISVSISETLLSRLVMGADVTGGLNVSRRVALSLEDGPASPITFPLSDFADYSYTFRNESNDTIQVGFGFRRPATINAGEFDPYAAFAPGGASPTFTVTDASNNPTTVSWPATGDGFEGWVGASTGVDLDPGATVTVSGQIAADEDAIASETATLEFAARILQPEAWTVDATTTEAGSTLALSPALTSQAASELTLASTVRTVAAPELTLRTPTVGSTPTVAELDFATDLTLSAATAELISYVRRTGQISEEACEAGTELVSFPKTNRALALDGTLTEGEGTDVLNAPLVPGTCVEYALRVFHARQANPPTDMDVRLDVPIPVRVLETELTMEFVDLSGTLTTETDAMSTAQACGTDAGDVCRVTVSGLALPVAESEGTPVIGEVRIRGYVD